VRENTRQLNNAKNTRHGHAAGEGHVVEDKNTLPKKDEWERREKDGRWRWRRWRETIGQRREREGNTLGGEMKKLSLHAF